MEYDLTPRQLLHRLVSFPTVSADTNLPLVDFVQDYLAHHGIESHRILDETGTKAGVIAQVGPDVPGGVALSGHTDVVPVEGQDWVTNPWEVIEADGKLFGRGTCDMKGFDALALHAMAKAKSRPLKRPLMLALSRDEEIGLLGADDVAQGLLSNYAKAGAVIIGEPTTMQVVSGHKCCEGMHVHVQGFEVHSSKLFEGVSAIYAASQLIEWARLQSVANSQKTPSAVAALYEPPYTTLHVGQVNGGTAMNITAKDCHFTMDIRCVGDEDVNDWIAKFAAQAKRVEAEMQAIYPDASISFTQIPGPGVVPEKDGMAEGIARQLTGDNASRTVAYGTDGGYFQAAGFSTVICGPGSIDQAHQPNEFIEISQFQAGEAVLDRLLDTLEKDA